MPGGRIRGAKNSVWHSRVGVGVLWWGVLWSGLRFLRGGTQENSVVRPTCFFVSFPFRECFGESEILEWGFGPVFLVA